MFSSGLFRVRRVSAQRVAVEQVLLAGRGGDAGARVPPHAADVADLVLLHTDVDMHRLLTDVSTAPMVVTSHLAPCL